MHNPSSLGSYVVAEQQATINSFVVLVASIAAVAGILFGFDTGVISGAILFIRKDFMLSGLMEGLIVSSVLWGAVIGSAVSGYFADYFGRKLLLILTGLIFIVGTLASAFSPTVPLFFFSRLIVGFAIGVASFVSPLYISEVAPPRFRGMLVSLNQLAITIGILCSYGVDAYFAETGEWCWMLGIGVIPAVILFFGMLMLPQSPRWIVLKGRIDKARHILKMIRRQENVEAELNDIKNSIEEKRDWRLLFQKWLRPAIILGIGLGFFQQCTGINAIIYYAPTIFEMAGFKTASAAISVTAIVGIVNVLFTIIALPLIDLWGRRPLLLLGLTGMGISLLILSISFYVGADSEMLKWSALLSMVGFIIFFAMSLGPIMWLVIAEVFPLEIRGLGTSLMISASWIFNGMVAGSFITLVHLFDASGTFLIFAVLSVLGIVFVYRTVPETKGVSLEHIEANLRAGVPSRQLGHK